VKLSTSLIAESPLARLAPPAAIWVAVRSDGLPDPSSSVDPIMGDGSAANPFDGSTPAKFDHIFRYLVGSGLTIRLGIGVFRTWGGDANSHAGSWVPKSGQRIVGSGVHQTILRLIIRSAGSWEDQGYTVIGADQDISLDNFEISDLTLDANVHRQPLRTDADATRPKIVCAGLQFLKAKNTRIRRVRFINFGTQTPEKVLNTPNPYTHECFALTLGGGKYGEGQNNLIEDCLFELPGHDQGREVTCANLSDPQNGVLRTTRVDGMNSWGSYPPVPVVSATHTSGTTTARTRWPHCLVARQPAAASARWTKLCSGRSTWTRASRRLSLKQT